MVKVNTWPLDSKSDPDLYIGVDSEAPVDQNNYTYKSNQIGADQVFMLPDNPKFKCGLWKVAIHAFNQSEVHNLGVKISVREAKPITMLNSESTSTTATVTDSMFFKYTIANTSDLENLLLLINVSNRKHLQVYIHKNSYPSEQFSEHEYALGDIPEHVLRAMF